MHIKRLAAASAASILTLSLVACGSNDDNTEASENTPTANMTSEPDINSSAVETELGSTATLHCGDGCVLSIRLDDIDTLDTCPDGQWDDSKDLSGKRIIKIDGEIEGLSVPNVASIGNTEVITESGITESADHECYQSTSSQSVSVSEGQKKNLDTIYTLPADSEKLTFDGALAYSLPDDTDGADVQDDQPAAAAEPTVVECLPGTPGPAEWSDGTTRPAEECSDPDYAAAESQSGFDPSDQSFEEMFPYAPYGRDEDGIPEIPEGTSDEERCHMMLGAPCGPQEQSEFDQFGQNMRDAMQ